MVWGCMSAAGTGELKFIEGNMDSTMYCDILKEKMLPSLPEASFQADNCLSEEVEGQCVGVAKHVT